MKKFFVCILAAVLAANAFAERVSREEALCFARQFFSDTPQAALKIVWSGDQTEAAFYVIERSGGGFLILSGETAVHPVLGYSGEGRFVAAEMPEHMRAWFSTLERDVVKVRSLRAAAGADVRDAWENLGVRTRSSGSGLLIESAQWDQSGPYNKYCPVINGRKSVTGCVATAMAITMRHNKYPAHGYGYLNAYTTSTERARIEGFSIDDHFYDWDAMPLTDVLRASDEAKDQIARLMYDCGVMVQMDFSPYGSGAVSMYTPGVMAEHFAYSAEAMLFRKSMYKPKEWIALVKQELDADRLVFYSAHDAMGQGGHAFVIDGYDQNDLFHVNWGWSGSGNGYYNLDMEVEGYRFSADHGAVLGLVPDPERSRSALSYLALTGKGLSLSSGRIEEGKTFSVEVNNITNYGNAEFQGPLMVVLTDEEDRIKETLGTPVNVKIPALSTASATISGCKMTVRPDFKDHVSLAYKDSRTAEYVVMRSDVENESVGGLAAIPNFIAGKTSYSAGERFEFKLFKSGEKFMSAVWYFDGRQVPEEEEDIVLTAGTHEVKVIITKSSGSEILVRELIVK